MKKYIFDTGALMLYFAGHTRARELIDEVKAKNREAVIPLVVFIEFYYKSAKEYGKEITRMRLASLKTILQLENVLEEKNALIIGEIKLNNNSLSFVDSVLVLTAKKENGIIITTDTPVAKIKGISSEKLLY